MSSISGADDTVYLEYKKTSSSGIKHPLFKKFRGWLEDTIKAVATVVYHRYWKQCQNTNPRHIYVI